MLPLLVQGNPLLNTNLKILRVHALKIERMLSRHFAEDRNIASNDRQPMLRGF